MKKILWAVICGNIRDELDFKLTLTKLVEMRSQGKISHILLSTWHYEIDKYEKLRDTLKYLNIFVIESNSISDELQNINSNSVNYWRQSKQLLAALDVIPKDNFILRVRTDRSLNYINQMEKLGVFENFAIEAIQYGQFPKLFKYKIFVFGPKTVRLMHMIDFAFLGYSRDLYKMINFDLNDIMFRKSIVANAQWFMYPFIREFQVLRDYMSFTVFNNTIKTLKEYVDKNKDLSDFPEIYFKVYAIYILIMYTHFKILYFGRIDDSVLSETSFYHFFTSSEKNNLYATSLGTSIRNENILEFAVKGKFKNSVAYSKFMDCINGLVAGGNSNKYELNYEDIVDLEKFVKNEIYCDNKEIKWYRKLNTRPLKLNVSYKDSYEVSGLNCILTDVEFWNKLISSENLERKLMSEWMDLKNPNHLTTEKMLIPVSKTGNQYAIYILADMCFYGYISNVNIAEIIRVLEFYLNIHIKKKTNTNITLRIAFKYLSLIDSGFLLSPNIDLDKLFNCVFSRFDANFSSGKPMYKIRLIELLDSDLLSLEDRFLFESILMDIGNDVDKEKILKYYNNENNVLERIVVNKSYSQNGF